MFIYMITNLINSKIYIGKTINSIKQRMCEHISFGNRNKTKIMLISRAIQKYGKENFSIQILTECNNIQDLNEWEIMFIHLAKNKSVYPYGCYNIAEGGKGGDTYTYLSEIDKQKRIEKMKKSRMMQLYGFKHTEENKKKISSKMMGNKNAKGNKYSEETKKKMSSRMKGRTANNKGKKMLDEQKLKISISQKLRWEKYKRNSLNLAV